MKASSLTMKGPTFGYRHVFIFWGFIGYLISYMMRINLSVAIVAMVNQTALSTLAQNKHFECEVINNVTQSSTTNKASFNGEFNWSQYEQGIILGGFFWGYLTSQLPGGMLANRFSAKWTLGLSLLFSSILTLFVPLAAQVGPEMLFAIRILQGISEGGITPSAQTLIGRWSPSFERSKLNAIINSGTIMGNIIGLPASGLLCQYGYAGGWPSAFYTFGALGCIWFCCWSFFIYDDPSIHPYISDEEKQFIHATSGCTHKVRKRVPWCSIITSPPCWATLCGHFASNWCFYTFVTLLPTYMALVLGFELSANGFLSAIPYIADYIMVLSFSFIADMIISRRLLSTTCTRKIFNTVGIAGAGLGLIGVGFVGCDSLAAVILFCISLGILSLCMAGGYSVCALDIAPQYAGSIISITNSISTLPGILCPLIAGIITETGNTSENWFKIFLISAGVSWFGGFVFLIFGSAERQPWAIEDEEATPLLVKDED